MRDDGLRLLRSYRPFVVGGIGLAEAHAPDADAGDLYPGMPQFRVFHVPSSIGEAVVLVILELQPWFKSRLVSLNIKEE